MTTEKLVAVGGVNEPATVETSAEQLVHALARLAHYRTVLRRAGQEIERRLTRLDGLAATVGAANEPTAVLREALNAALGIMMADTGAILVIEDERQPPTLGAQYQLSEDLAQLLIGQSFELAALLLPHLFEGRQIILNVNDERATSDSLRALLFSLRLSWLVGLPLRSGGKLLGALIVAGHTAAVITQQDNHWLALVGQQAALALEAVHLRRHMWSLAEAIFGHEVPAVTASTPAPAPRQPPEDLEALLEAMMSAEEEVQRFNQDLTALNHLAEAMSQSLDPDTVVREAVNQCVKMVGLEKAWLYLVEDDPPSLVLHAHNSLSTRYLQSRGRLDPGDGNEWRIARGEVEELLINDMLEGGHTTRLIVDAEGLRAQCLLPLSARGRVLGVLGGAQSQPHVWTPREVRLLKAVAGQAALALHNALLYDQVRDAAQAQTMSNRVLQELNRDLLDSQAAELAHSEAVQESEARLHDVFERGTRIHVRVGAILDELREVARVAGGTGTTGERLQALIGELHGLEAELRQLQASAEGEPTGAPA